MTELLPARERWIHALEPGATDVLHHLVVAVEVEVARVHGGVVEPPHRAQPLVAHAGLAVHAELLPRLVERQLAQRDPAFEVDHAIAVVAFGSGIGKSPICAAHAVTAFSIAAWRFGHALPGVPAAAPLPSSRRLASTK
jgi:hypothetical protein